MRQRTSNWASTSLALTALTAVIHGSVAAGTVAHWRFEDGLEGGSVTAAVDAGPGGFDGSVIGSLLFAGTTAPYETTGDLSLDARGDFNYVSVPDARGLRLLEDFTLEAFVWVDGVESNPSAEPHGIAGKRHAFEGGECLSSYALQYNQKTGEFGATVCFSNDAGLVLTSPAEFVAAGWYHVAMTVIRIDGDLELRLFVDGLEQGDATAEDAEILYGEEPFLIGAGKNSDDFFRRNFDGLIDEVRLSDVALEPEDFLNGGLVPIRLSSWGAIKSVYGGATSTD